MADVVELTKEESAFFDSRGEQAPAAPAAVETPKPAEAEAKPAADPKAEAEPEAKGGVVPQQALHEERERRKAAQKERDDAKTAFTKLQSRLDTLAEVAKAQQQPAPVKEVEIPDVNTDPVGHFRAKDAIRERELNELKAWKTAQEQQFQATNNVQRIASIAQAQEREFIKTAPDYMEASEHLKTLRDRQLIAYGVNDPTERQNIIAQDAIQIAANALSQNKNPAQVIWDMATASGYKKAEAKPATASGTAPSETEKVRMAAAGQKAGASLGQLSGGATPPTTLEALSRMSDEEFADATKGDKWRKLFT
jgi:hypothetical protein